MQARALVSSARPAQARLPASTADAVFAAAPQQPVEARRGDKILRQRLGVEAQRARSAARDEAPAAGRQIGIARIAAPDVRAERAAQALRVGRGR